MSVAAAVDLLAGLTQYFSDLGGCAELHVAQAGWVNFVKAVVLWRHAHGLLQLGVLKRVYMYKDVCSDLYTVPDVFVHSWQELAAIRRFTCACEGIASQV